MLANRQFHCLPLAAVAHYAFLCAVSFGAAERIPIVTFDATSAADSADPELQGWTKQHDKPLDAISLSVGQGAERVWRIEDDDADGPEGFYYRSELTDDQKQRARKNGFTYRWQVRIPDDTGGPTRAIGTEVCVCGPDGQDRLRFGLQMGRRGEELAASIHVGTRGTVEGSLIISDPDDFHTWMLLFDPETNTVNVFVDDTILLSTEFDHLDNGHDLVFGSRSTGTGISEWRRVEFLVGIQPGVQIVPPPRPPHRIDVFVSGQDEYFAYRIPSLIGAADGTLLAICEGRKSSLADLGNNDLVLKRSTDNGTTWSPMEVIYDEGDKVTIGNPTPVVDRSTGTIWLVFSRDATDVLMITSRDNGRTWSKPSDITSQVKEPDWKFYAVGPGVGIQLEHGPHKGRLLIPAYHRTTESKSGPAIAHVFYSDDQGETWQIGGSVGPHTCECQVAETLAGDRPGLLINSRNHWARSGGRPDLAGVRIISRSSDGGETWSEPTFDKTLIEPTCQGSLFRYSWPGDSNSDRSRILFANPASRSRGRMTVRMSYDEGRTWPVSRLVDPGSAAYSCLARLSDGRIGLLYESGGYKRVTFAAFGLEWLSSAHESPSEKQE